MLHVPVSNITRKKSIERKGREEVRAGKQGDGRREIVGTPHWGDRRVAHV